MTFLELAHMRLSTSPTPKPQIPMSQPPKPKGLLGSALSQLFWVGFESVSGVGFEPLPCNNGGTHRSECWSLAFGCEALRVKLGPSQCFERVRPSEGAHVIYLNIPIIDIDSINHRLEI